MTFDPCLCGDSQCPLCGDLQGECPGCGDPKAPAALACDACLAHREETYPGSAPAYADD